MQIAHIMYMYTKLATANEKPLSDKAYLIILLERQAFPSSLMFLEVHKTPYLQNFIICLLC